jgi:homoserine O-succinyltransferase
MADGALESTERQFSTLLHTASVGRRVQLTFYALPGVPRSPSAAEHIARSYGTFESLLRNRMDGLIVTGREPSTTRMQEEPYWESFTKLLDWATENTYSAVWSCLAAHAGVLYMDGIHRVKSERKHFGLFTCRPVVQHALTAGTPACFTVPHSRWNGIPDEELDEHGYTVLTRSEDVGADTFIKRFRSLFVFLQGHPEYASDTLLLEYRRDVARYFRRDIDRYPNLPQAYFAADTACILKKLADEARSGRSPRIFTETLQVLEGAAVKNNWRSAGIRRYANWLSYIADAKASVADGIAPLVQIRETAGSQPGPLIAARPNMPFPVQSEHAVQVRRAAV